MSARNLNKMQNLAYDPFYMPLFSVPFGVTYEENGNDREKGFIVYPEDFTMIPGVVNHSICPFWILAQSVSRSKI
jgi:hypothetical protein